MACVMRSTYLSFCPIMFSSPVEKERCVCSHLNLANQTKGSRGSYTVRRLLVADFVTR